MLRYYQDRVYALAYRLTYEKELARDIAQDVFLRLYEKLDRWDPTRPFEPWFMSLATNYTLNARQKARLRKTLSLDAPLGSGGDKRPEPEDTGGARVDDAVSDAEARGHVRDAIRSLPDKYAGVVVLHYLEGLGVNAIAERMGMPAGTVKIRLHRARNLLREKLKRFREGS